MIYTAFFVRGEDLFLRNHLLSNEYLFINIPSISTWSYWSHFLIYPFLATIFIFWVMPFITRPFFLKNIRNKKALKLIELIETREIKKEEKKLVIAEKDLIEEESRKAKQMKKTAVETPEVLWAIEYSEFEKKPLISEFSDVVKKVYKNDSEWLVLSTAMKAFIDLNGLGSVENGYPNTVNLTLKGKFFVKKYLERNPGIN